jgi:CO dehydrogenase maturation factor
MGQFIAITGKGGVGKTTVAALLVSRLIARGRKPVLAVDADPNSCLDLALGVKVGSTLGRVREDTRQAAGSGQVAGVAKQQMLELKIAESLVERENFDLLAMGRPEGPGCYCYANNVLKDALARIAGQYPYVVLDNEAGLENLSRRIVQKVSLLVIVADASRAGLDTVKRLFDLAKEMEISYDKLAIVINRLRNGSLPRGVEELKSATGAFLVLGFPTDEELAAAAEAGQSLNTVKDSNPVVQGVDKLLAEAGL